MSIWAEIWAYEQEARNSGERFVLVAVAHFSDRDGDGWPGQRSIAKMTMQTQRTVRRHLASWEKRGVLMRRARYRKDGSRTSDLYHLNAPFERLGPPDTAPRDKLTRPADKLAGGPGLELNGAPVSGDRTTGSDCPGSDLPMNDHGSNIEEGESTAARNRSRSRRATELPEGFKPDEESLALLDTLALDPEYELANFVDSHREGERRRDWQARFRTWIRKSPAFNAKNGLNGDLSPKRQKLFESIQRLRAKEGIARRGCTHVGCEGLEYCRLSGPKVLYQEPVNDQPEEKAVNDQQLEEIA